MNAADDRPPRREDALLRADLKDLCEVAIGLAAAYWSCGMEEPAEHWAHKAFEMRDAGCFDVRRVPAPDLAPPPPYRQGRSWTSGASRSTSRSRGRRGNSAA